ncbi:MAG: hypothetical protein AAF711_00340 [Planctomycetota bacterium]
MKTFNDNTGRTWSLTINVDAIKRVRGLLDVDLMQAIDGKLLERLVTDPVLLCDVVYALCKPEADAKGVTDEQFGQAMAGDAIDSATTALLEELVGFFPQAKRQVLRKALDKLKVLETKVFDAVTARLDSGEIDRMLEAELNKVNPGSGGGGLSMTLPGSSASNPDP